MYHTGLSTGTKMLPVVSTSGPRGLRAGRPVFALGSRRLTSPTMEPRLRPVETVTPCKCCGTAAALYGVVDFTKSCEEGRGKILPLSGVPVYYHRCPACGFIFTIAFDDFSPEDFARHVYNDEYILVDPDYTRVRPEANARSIAGAFKGARSLRILDYGGGTGVLAEGLRAAGFQDVQTYDP